VGQELEEAADGEGPGLEGPFQAQSLFHQFRMLLRMVLEAREAPLREDRFLIVEVLDHRRQEGLDESGAFIGGTVREEGVEEFVGQLEQMLMLGIDKGVPAAEGRAPDQFQEIPLQVLGSTGHRFG